MNASLRLLPLSIALSCALSFALSCATPPVVPAPPPPIPDVPLSLSVTDAEAVPRGLTEVAIAFFLEVRNTEDRPARLDSLAWSLSVDGSAVPGGPSPLSRTLAPGEVYRERFETLVGLQEASMDAAEYAISASATRVLEDGSPLVSMAEASGTFPVVREPRFSIRSIKIKKAELINTKFEVVLRVENPNAVPLTLTALNYELYGEGRLWTDGGNRDAIPVPAKGTVDKKLMLVMNFINMKRDLLDQVIRLEIVDYRFKGDARITTTLPAFPEFVLPYDLRGRTSVVE